MKKYVDPVALEIFAKTQWNKDAALRDEFNGNFEHFYAYTKGVASGNIKILSAQTKNGS